MHKVFDSHLHIIDFAHPIQENQGYTPPEFLVADYNARREEYRARGFDIVAGAVVSGSFQGFDQGYLADSLAALGQDYAGVTQLPGDVSDAEIRRLDALGVRAVRFNFRRGGSAGAEDLKELGQRVYDLAGWHVELYVDSAELESLAPALRELPAVSIDHLGLNPAGLPQLLDLVEHGVKVKATGFGRVDLDPAEAMAQILEVNPQALMAGTDLPSQRAKRPFGLADFELIAELAGAHADDVLYGNAARFYGVG